MQFVENYGFQPCNKASSILHMQFVETRRNVGFLLPIDYEERSSTAHQETITRFLMRKGA